MNQRRSKESLNNDDDDEDFCYSSGSSTPTDFTSDDDASTFGNRSLFNQKTQSNTSDDHFKYPFRGSSGPTFYREADSIKQYISSPEYKSPGECLNQYVGYMESERLNNIHLNDESGDENYHVASKEGIEKFSGSFYESFFRNSNNNSPLIPDVVASPESISLTGDRERKNYMRRCNNAIHSSKSHPQSVLRSGMNVNNLSANTSRAMDVDSSENITGCVNENESRDLFERDESSCSPIRLSIYDQNCNSTIRLCSQIYECRSLTEAIEFVERNRDLIEPLIKIVEEAPSFRNYEMSNYQIDNSIKESFNPNFWSDREPVVTTADGNCQYHAVSISLTGTEAYTPAVRLAAAVAVIDNRQWFESILKLIDRGSVFELVRTIARSYSWGDETTLKAVAIAIKRRIYLYTCNTGRKDFEMVKSLSGDDLLDAFKEKKYRGGTGIHTYADPLVSVSPNEYIMLFHKSEHFIAVLPTSQQLTNYEPYNPIVPVFV